MIEKHGRNDACPFPGYGHIAPTTSLGKLATIFYTIAGIPLFLLYLSNIGDILATSFKWTYSRICKCQKAPSSKGPPQVGPDPSTGLVGVLKRPNETAQQYRVKTLADQVNNLSAFQPADQQTKDQRKVFT